MTGETLALGLAVADALPQPIWTARSDGSIAYANQAWHAYTGFRPGASLGTGWAAAVHPDDVPVIEERFRAASAAEEPYEVEHRFRRADGAYRWHLARVAPLRDSGGGIVGWVGTATDIDERKRAGEATARLAAIVGTSRDAIIGTDPEGVVTTWNPAAEALFGYTAEEAVGRDVAFLLPPNRADERVAVYRRLQNGERVPPFETVRVRKDGTPVSVEIAPSPVVDADGRLTSVAAILRNVTERRRAEAAQRESEERYRTLFASIDEGFCVVEVIFDPDGHPVDYRFLEANPAFERHTGLPGAVGHTARELVPDLEAHWFDTYGRVASTGEPVRFVDEAKPMGGRSFDVYAFRLGAPALRQVAILFTDITQRRRDEEARARLAAIVENSWDAIVGRNLDGTITSWSPGAEALYGHAAEEIVGQSIARLLPTGQEEELVDLTTRLGRGERILPFETVRLHKDGTPIEVEMSISPILGDAGTPLGAAAIARDIRARRAGERLQQEFLEAVSHDLKNPLAAIRGQAQLLQRRARRATPDQNVVIGTLVGIETATQRMETQLGELQDAARLRSGHPIELHAEPVDLAALAEEAVAEARRATSRHDVRLEVPDGALVGRWDALRLRRVIDNLLSNALKYSEGGEVVVTIREEQRENGLWAVFAVRDEGVGIPAVDLPHVFERYRRGSNVGPRGRGTGIGLAGSYQIVEQHGGTITVESEEGSGSTCTVVLPLDPPVSRQAE